MGSKLNTDRKEFQKLINIRITAVERKNACVVNLIRLKNCCTENMNKPQRN
jgi:hypothetical protein